MKRVDELKQRLRLAWAILRDRDGNLVDHAKRELRAAGLNDGDEMNEAMSRHLVDMVRAFSVEGHSGFSAGYARGALSKLLAFKPLVPLTGAPDEWHEVGPGVYQNKRCGRVFKDAERFDGQPYDIDAIVFREPSGACYTSAASVQPVTFPYTPTTEYRDVPFATA